MRLRLIFTTILVAASGTAVLTSRAQDRAPRLPQLKPGRPSNQRIADRYRIVYPPGFDATWRLTPVVYALHGHGSSMDFMQHAWARPCAELGAILVVMQGSKLVDGGCAWSGPEDASRMIDAARKALARRVKLDRSAPRVLTGISQGAFITYAIAREYPATWRRLVPIVGMFWARSDQAIKPFSEDEKQALRRWRVYMMVGVKDRQELVADNGRLAGELERLGAAVCAPFRDKGDPSWAMYQAIGHALPESGEKREAEVARALRFVLQPDLADARNWSNVDRDWRTRAAWLDIAKSVRP